jgi:hypothetical protein
MKYVSFCLAILVLALGAACGSDSPTGPSTNATAKFTANLSPASEIPAITGAEAAGSATAAITFNLSKDSNGYVTAASLDVTVTAAGFPNNTTLTMAHIHSGGPDVNGGVFVSFGLAAGEVSYPAGGGTFTKTGISLTVDQANAILANPAGFYVNIHTAANPNGVARGQLTPAP